MKPPPRLWRISVMLLIPCPYCGERPELEFQYAGEAGLKRDISASDEGWADFLYVRTNTKGVHEERWRHLHGCGRFFNARRDTVRDVFSVDDPAP
jgi:sarcosine oxidase subunit delta